MKVTAETITLEQIEQLEHEAIEAGDEKMALLCSLAVNATEPTKAVALQKCVEAINAALDQID